MTRRAEQQEETIHPTRLAVLECKLAARMTLAVVQVLEGALTTGMSFAADDTGERWEIRGFAFAPLAAIEQGRHGVLLAPVGHDGQLRSGARLHQLLSIATNQG